MTGIDMIASAYLRALLIAQSIPTMPKLTTDMAQQGIMNP